LSQEDKGEEVLSDFIPKPYGDPFDSTEWDEYKSIPMDFYDNDDGFWDNHIAEKNKQHEEWAMTEMIVGRPFLKH